MLAAVVVPGGFVTAAGAATGTPTHQSKKKKKKKAPTPTLTLAASLTTGPGELIARPPIGISIEYPLMAADDGTGGMTPARSGSPFQQFMAESFQRKLLHVVRHVQSAGEAVTQPDEASAQPWHPLS